jgi:DNA-binding SARP family transcriptional activator
VLKVRLFGKGQAYYEGHPLTGFPNQQSYLLLCYLLLNRCHHYPRERLAAVFWGEYPTSTSRKYLRNALWRLRCALQSAGTPVDEYLLISDDSISFSSSSRYWLDVQIFETTTIRYQDIPGQELTPEQVAHLEGDIDLYVGYLMEGIYEDWCLYDRERLDLLYLNTLSKLMVFHETNGTYERGLACGERILSHDNTREKVHRQMMRLYWKSGDRSAALAQYKLCAQALREALDISPMKVTSHLYLQMQCDQFDPTTWPGPHNNPLPAKIESDEATQLLAEQALQRLDHLQATIVQASTELLHIKQQLRKVLPNSSYLQLSVPNPDISGK